MITTNRVRSSKRRAGEEGERRPDARASGSGSTADWRLRATRRKGQKILSNVERTQWERGGRQQKWKLALGRLNKRLQNVLLASIILTTRGDWGQETDATCLHSR